jgi:hypothetical protein
VKATLTPRDRGLGHAMRIQRQHDPREWRRQVDAIEDADERAVAEEYLRGMVDRIRVLRALKRG